MDKPKKTLLPNHKLLGIFTLLCVLTCVFIPLFAAYLPEICPTWMLCYENKVNGLNIPTVISLTVLWSINAISAIIGLCKLFNIEIN